jgi:hypothetical protein
MNLRVGNKAPHIVLALMVLFSLSSRAWAWGDEGHKVVCEIAMRLAVPSTRAEIRRLIKTDTEFDIFSRCLHLAGSPSEARRRALRKSCERFERANFGNLSRRARMRRVSHSEGRCSFGFE